MRDTGTDRRERDGMQAMLVGDLEAAPRRPAQALGRGVAAEPHAGRVDYVAGSERAAARDRGVAHLDRTNRPALGLDRRPTRSGDGARDSTSQLEVVVGGVDDGIDILNGEIALLDFDRQALDPPAHAVG